MISTKLTICFEKPFWVGLIEQQDGDRYQVARHVFGAEPTDPEIEAFIHDKWASLHFSAQLQVEKIGGRKINHKRMQRLIAKEIAANARRGTKAQRALTEEREAHKTERKTRSKEQREAEKEAKFQQRTQKRKEKHRGH